MVEWSEVRVQNLSSSDVQHDFSAETISRRHAHSLDLELWARTIHTCQHQCLYLQGPILLQATGDPAFSVVICHQNRLPGEVGKVRAEELHHIAMQGYMQAQQT